MVEQYVERVHNDIVLDIGGEIGALIIYTRAEMCGQQIDVSPQGNPVVKRIHTDVLERRIAGRPVFAAVFPELPEGDYHTWSDPTATFSIAGGRITELDWRNIEVYVPPVASSSEGRNTASRSFITPRQLAVKALANILPPRYQGDVKVSAAPMGTAPMRYTDNGEVAWDKMWTTFCDLALAGGPPHRDTLLEPVPPEEVRANLPGYERVLAQIERGLQLVTGQPIVRSERLGWIGIQCTDEEMALWLLRAIIVENVCVRREGNVLFLPAGPDFRLEKEIKNVITVVAKTHHYWTEHLSALNNEQV
jgi:hypothetical protein